MPNNQLKFEPTYRTLTKNLGAHITLAPLPFFDLIGDLSVATTGKWMRGMSERLHGWLHMKDSNPDVRRIEERMDPDLASSARSGMLASTLRDN